MQVLRRMDKLVSEIRAATPAAVTQGALAAKRVHLNELRLASGGDLRLSGVGKKGAKVGVRYDVSGTSNPTAFIRATGPVHFVENPSKPHPITPRAPGSRQRAQSGRPQSFVGLRPLGTPYGPRYRVNHPGVRNPYRPWAKGAVKARPLIDRAIKSQLSSAFRRGVT